MRHPCSFCPRQRIGRWRLPVFIQDSTMYSPHHPVMIASSRLTISMLPRERPTPLVSPFGLASPTSATPPVWLGYGETTCQTQRRPGRSQPFVYKHVINAPVARGQSFTELRSARLRRLWLFNRSIARADNFVCDGVMESASVCAEGTCCSRLSPCPRRGACRRGATRGLSRAMSRGLLASA